MTLIADAFPKLQTLKNKLHHCLISPVSGVPSKLLKSERQHPYHIY